MFHWLEKNPFFFTVVFLLVFSIAGLVEILPDFAKASRPTENLKPYTLLETAGRQIYIAESCNACHSQLVRPFKAETDRYGAYSLSGEYAYDRPFLWGSKRTGPDLHRVGDYRTTDWHEEHMLNPEAVVPGSIMPAYAHLYKKNVDVDTVYAEAYTQKVVFAVPYDTENNPKLGDLEAARAEILAEAKILAEDMKDPEIKAALERGEIKQIVSLIAYLNSLGQKKKGELVVEYETIQIIQGYAYWFITLLLVVLLYAYIYHLYKSQKSGKIDYEKYARLALDDELDDCLIEKRNQEDKKKES